ncbi:MAG: DUF3991 and toprim domain-containing protein [Clostridium sp.]|nr:DUF3991 and toprim domain-containing protein [Clostridium sp.]
MPYLSEEEIRQAKEPDALSWLLSNEPHKVVRIGGGYYRSREHDSLKLDHERWNWWSRGIGGRSAVDYFVRVEGLTFYEACLKVLGKGTACTLPALSCRDMPHMEKIKFVLPERAASNEEAVRYLQGRGICNDVIGHFLFCGDIYRQKEHKNVVFVGRDYENVPRMAALRGIYAKYHHTAAGSDRAYSFRNTGCRGNTRLDVFEAPVDMLSYATLLYDAGKDFADYNMLALCGIYKGRKNPEETTLPAALKKWLEQNETEMIVLHFDNDVPGKEAAEAVKAVLGNRYNVITSPAPDGKDVNAYLVSGGKLWD